MDLEWHVVAGGGGRARQPGGGPGFELEGTVGQAVAGPVAAAESELDSGFWVPPDIYEFKLDFSSGWNLVSVPIQPLHPELSDLFEGRTVPSVWELKGIALAATDRLAAGKAYWLHSPAAGEVIIKGKLPTRLMVRLNEGWNLLGRVCRPPYGPVQLPLPTDPPGAPDSPAFGWDPETGEYVQISEIVAGAGAWMRALFAAVWTQP